MGNLYLIDRDAGEMALPLAAADPEALVVLIQDGVYLDAQLAVGAGRPVCALAPDLKVRGLEGRLPPQVKAIEYSDLVDLIFAHKVINFA